MPPMPFIRDVCAESTAQRRAVARQHAYKAIALTDGWGSAGTRVESFAVQPGMVRTDLWNPEKTDTTAKWAAFITGANAAGWDVV